MRLRDFRHPLRGGQGGHLSSEVRKHANRPLPAQDVDPRTLTCMHNCLRNRLSHRFAFRLSFSLAHDSTGPLPLMVEESRTPGREGA